MHFIIPNYDPKVHKAVEVKAGYVFRDGKSVLDFNQLSAGQLKTITQIFGFYGAVPETQKVETPLEVSEIPNLG